MTGSDATEEEKPSNIWDAVVVGAGPAGAVISLLLAREGIRTLLAEAKSFPRPKVCGGCLNARSVAALHSIGLGDDLHACGPVPIDRLAIYHAGRTAEITLPPGLSVTRSTLDAALVKAAIRAGATFLPETTCRVLPNTYDGYRRIRMTSSDGRESIVAARAVVASDGLGNPSLANLPDFKSSVSPGSRIGLGAVIAECSEHGSLPSGTISMAVAEEGYVGMARAESGQLTIAAAVDSAKLADAKSPASLVRRIVQTAGVSGDLISDQTTFRGTLPMTRTSSQVAAERLLVVGDAAGYVEPFTGEGMAAAIEGAIAVAPLARQAVVNWDTALAQTWQTDYSRRIRSRQRTCRTLAWLVRHPRLLHWGLTCVSRQRFVGTTVARWVGS